MEKLKRNVKEAHDLSRQKAIVMKLVTYVLLCILPYIIVINVQNDLVTDVTSRKVLIGLNI